jgi:hydroxymethylpyrimidine pyrophosphatase-like HAD family hydrolase
MPIRLLAIDLDGTLLNGRSQISAVNREALRLATEKGVRLVVVTGRRYHSARAFLEQIPRPVTLIASNGAWIGSPAGDVFFRNFLPGQAAREALEAARGFRPYAAAIFDTSKRGQLLMEQNAAPEGPLSWYLRNYPDLLLQVPDLPAAISGDPVQVLFGGPPPAIEPIEPLLRSAIVASKVHLTWTKYLDRNMSILDVMNRGCSKGSALKLWAEQCGVSPREVMAIGDNYNDLEMLELSGQPVVMANSSAELKRDGWATTLSNDEDGVAAAVEKYVLGGSATAG